MPFFILIPAVIFNLLSIANFIMSIVYKCRKNKLSFKKGIKVVYVISIILLVITPLMYFSIIQTSVFLGTNQTLQGNEVVDVFMPDKIQILISNIIYFLTGIVLILNIVSIIILAPERKRVIREEFKERIVKNKNEKLFIEPTTMVEWEELQEQDRKKYLDYAIELYFETMLELDDLSKDLKAKINQYLSKNNFKIEDVDKDHHQMIYDKAKEIYEHEKGSFKYNKIIDDFYGLTTKKQNKIINEVCLRLFEKELTDKDIHKDLTKEQIEYRRQAVKNRQVDYNQLIDEEKFIVNSLINKKAKECAPKSEEYTKSKRYKLEVGQYISLSAFIVCIVLAVIFSLYKISTAFMYIFYFVSIAMLITTCCLKSAKRPYCKKCGCRGVIKDYQNEMHYDIDREKLTSAFGQGTAVFWTRDGHVSFDDKGNAYKEKLTQVTTHTYQYTCPCCEYNWTLKSITRK